MARHHNPHVVHMFPAHRKRLFGIMTRISTASQDLGAGVVRPLEFSRMSVSILLLREENRYVSGVSRVQGPRMSSHGPQLVYIDVHAIL